MNPQTIETGLRVKEYCVLDATQMATLPVDHRLVGTGAKHLAEMLQVRLLETGTTEFAGIENCAEKCVMVDIRDWYAGRADKAITGIVELSLYYSEVRPLVRLSTRRINERLEFAQRTGFLLMAADEAFAVKLERDGDPRSLSLACFMSDAAGKPRVLDGIYENTLSYHAAQKSIANLNRTQVESEIIDVSNDIFYEQHRNNCCSQHLERLRNSLKLLQEHVEIAKPERTESGAIIKRWHSSDDGSGAVLKLVKREDGWIRYPTFQDAWYFCIEINPRSRETICYAEGDVSHVKCDDQRQFFAELKSMAEFYGRGRTSAACGYESDGSVTHYFEHLFLLSGRLGTFKFDNERDGDNSTPRAPLFGALNLDHPVFTAMASKPEVEFQVPVDAFELDLLNPLAFETYLCKALIHADGIDVSVTFQSGKVVSGMLAAKDLEAAI